MMVRYVHSDRYSYGNITWEGTFPMRGGAFPEKHPCAGMQEAFALIGSQGKAKQPFGDDGLGRFRARGYEASCYPAGDGIVVKVPDGKSRDDVVRDIAVCFGWQVEAFIS